MHHSISLLIGLLLVVFGWRACFRVFVLSGTGRLPFGPPGWFGVDWRNLYKSGFRFIGFWGLNDCYWLLFWRGGVIWAGLEDIDVPDALTSELRRMTTGSCHHQSYILHPSEKERREERAQVK